MATIDERIATLEAKLKQEKARKQLIEARKRAAESKLKRSQDTRRKILVGAAVLGKRPGFGPRGIGVVKSA